MLKTPQAPGDATVLKRFFRDNFVIFRPRSKRIAFWNQWILLRVSICKFSIFVKVTWPLFGTLQGPIPAKCLVTDSSDYSKRHTFRVSAFHRYHWFWVKLFPVGCAQDSWRVPRNAKNAVLWIWLRPRYNIPIFHDSTHASTPPLWRFAAEIAVIRRLYIGLRVRYKYYIVVLVWPGAAHAPIAV